LQKLGNHLLCAPSAAQEGSVLWTFPRIEAAFQVTTRLDEAHVAGLDAMPGGGMVEATLASLLGPSGIGKRRWPAFHVSVQCGRFWASTGRHHT
jgi:hypothetical protein